MRPLGLTDTIFYNLGDAYITAVAVLEGSCDLAVLLAEVEGVVRALPGLSERQMRIGLWSFARQGAAIDLAEHVAIIRDPSVTTRDQIVGLLDRMRRTRILGGPAWRFLVLNPAEAGAGASDGRLSAVFVQARHGLAGAMRGLNILGKMGQYQPSPMHRALACHLPVVDLSALDAGIGVHDEGIAVVQIPRRGMSRDGEASNRLAMIAASAVGDAAFFPHAQPLRGNIGRTRFVRRRGHANGVGNHLKMETLRTGGTTKRRRLPIPGLSRAQDLAISQWLVALAPRRLARFAMRTWYASFDAVATLLPIPRRLHLGGQPVAAVFGVPPLWGPVPLVLVALADGDNYHVTIIPGRGFTGELGPLMERIRQLFRPEVSGETRVSLAAAERPAEDHVPAETAYAKR